jgi:hypothetical protein
MYNGGGALELDAEQQVRPFVVCPPLVIGNELTCEAGQRALPYLDVPCSGWRRHESRLTVARA